MTTAERELFDLLKQYGFELVRGKKHKIYKNPQGKSWVLPNSPSDQRWAENAMHSLKNSLGIGAQGKEAVVGERREKRSYHTEQRLFLSSLSGASSATHKPTLQDQLSAIIPTLFSGTRDSTTGKTIPLTPELEALKQKLSEMIFAGMTVKQIAENSGGVEETLVRIVIPRLFGKGIREIRKELQPVRPITTKELDYEKLELLIRAGYQMEKIAELVGYSAVRMIDLCKKYWDKTPKELRFKWADSTYEMLMKAKEIAEVPPDPPIPPQAAPVSAVLNPEFVDKDYPCVRCGSTIHLSAEFQQEKKKKCGRFVEPKLCALCHKFVSGEFKRIFPSQLQDGDRVIECLGCGNQILFARKQQDEFLVKGWLGPKFCRRCRTRSGNEPKARAQSTARDIEAHFMSQGAI